MSVLPKSFLCFDLDGTLVPRNQLTIKPDYLTKILNKLSGLGHISIPVTGKPTTYADQIFPLNGLIDSGIIAENAGVYRLPNTNKIEVYGPSIEQLGALRNCLEIGFDKVNVTTIKLKDNSYEVVIDPGDRSILTVFTDPAHVSHRWQFKHTISAEDVVEQLKNIIHENSWDTNLSVLPPFPDGGVQVIRKDSSTNQPVDKSNLTNVIQTMYPDSHNLPICMFGDGHNDIPAMSDPRVTGLTFSNAHPRVKEFVEQHKGYISPLSAPDNNGILDGLQWLANKNFFTSDTQKVMEILKQ